MNERFKLIAAIFVILIKDGKVFLSKRKNTGWEDGKYSLIGGRIEGNETARQAAVREAMEETGIAIKINDLKFANICHLITNSERVHLAFVIEKWNGEATNNEPEKAEEVGWFDFKNLPQNITEESKKTIEWYINGIKYSEIGWGK